MLLLSAMLEVKMKLKMMVLVMTLPWRPEGDDDETSEGIFSDDGNAIISGGYHGGCMDFY